jgi:hypothetical protein
VKVNQPNTCKNIKSDTVSPLPGLPCRVKNDTVSLFKAPPDQSKSDTVSLLKQPPVQTKNDTVSLFERSPSQTKNDSMSLLARHLFSLRRVGIIPLKGVRSASSSRPPFVVMPLTDTPRGFFLTEVRYA